MFSSLKDLAGIRLTREQFDALAKACGPNRGFPVRWEDWIQLIESADKAASLAGECGEPLAIEPARFLAWCTRVDVVPCGDALRAYAILHRSPRASRHYGAFSLDTRPAGLV